MSNVLERSTAMVSATRGGIFTRDYHPFVPSTHDDLATHLAAFRVCAQGGTERERERGKE